MSGLTRAYESIHTETSGDYYPSYQSEDPALIPLASKNITICFGEKNWSHNGVIRRLYRRPFEYSSSSSSPPAHIIYCGSCQGWSLTYIEKIGVNFFELNDFKLHRSYPSQAIILDKIFINLESLTGQELVDDIVNRFQRFTILK